MWFRQAPVDFLCLNAELPRFRGAFYPAKPVERWENTGPPAGLGPSARPLTYIPVSPRACCPRSAGPSGNAQGHSDR